ncbi:MAG: transglutaminase-like domain-containing protein [Gemmataceae bacterium]
MELQPEKRVVQGQTLSPGRSILWVDDQGVIRRRQIELDGLGTLVLERGTPGQGAPVATAVDIGARSLIPLDRTIFRPYQTQAVGYRFTVREEDDPASLVVNDDHQEVKNVSGGRFDLLVHPVRNAATGGAASPTPGPEYLSSSFFLDHDKPQIKELAQRILSEETDPWNRARKIERWVKNNLRNDNSAPLVPASQIATGLKGDCRHHSFLTAALARSVGIPSRTAIGLLYVNRGGPRLGFHMWTEVFIDGKWLGLDSTLGQGGVSACHIKVTQHHWMDVASLTPLLPVQRILGKVRVEVLRDS